MPEYEFKKSGAKPKQTAEEYLFDPEPSTADMPEGKTPNHSEYLDEVASLLIEGDAEKNKQIIEQKLREFSEKEGKGKNYLTDVNFFSIDMASVSEVKELFDHVLPKDEVAFEFKNVEFLNEVEPLLVEGDATKNKQVVEKKLREFSEKEGKGVNYMVQFDFFSIDMASIFEVKKLLDHVLAEPNVETDADYSLRISFVNKIVSELQEGNADGNKQIVEKYLNELSDLFGKGSDFLGVFNFFQTDMASIADVKSSLEMGLLKASLAEKMEASVDTLARRQQVFDTLAKSLVEGDASKNEALVKEQLESLTEELGSKFAFYTTFKFFEYEKDMNSVENIKLLISHILDVREMRKVDLTFDYKDNVMILELHDGEPAFNEKMVKAGLIDLGKRLTPAEDLYSIFKFFNTDMSSVADIKGSLVLILNNEPMETAMSDAEFEELLAQVDTSEFDYEISNFDGLSDDYLKEKYKLLEHLQLIMRKGKSIKKGTEGYKTFAERYKELGVIREELKKRGIDIDAE